MIVECGAYRFVMAIEANGVGGGGGYSDAS